MEAVSDGAAFNRLLCLSQLCHIIASNTWANTAPQILRACGRWKQEGGGEEAMKVKTGPVNSRATALEIRSGKNCFDLGAALCDMMIFFFLFSHFPHLLSVR